ncbi:TonB-dependent receptor [Chitinophaga agrisoli]|uniref:TonB-dependent receptor n=1 Tax=Chitinophaga agrisoli TaxID=2607653 RepID=A0A5B2VMS5_9BACT|nr:TonB-dependent receptor [Chitinophaga agrisoli]KAA2240381.1 TonB-dependent receptor [Chitinophaga agrisoli]
MKLTAFLMLAACLQISAKAVSQQITLSEKNASLKKVLKEVSRQAGISIVYDETLLARTRPVTVMVKNASVKEVLDQCLRDQPVFYSIDGQRIIIQKQLAPQIMRDTAITVSGRVTDEKGEPVPGATIRVQGTNSGTAADADGRYTIKVPQNSTLIITFLGYAPQTVTAAGGTLNVKLALSQTALTETVVVGYGVQKKSVVTGAISSVRAADIENMPITRPEQTLQGRTSGVTIASSSGQPGSPANVRIRGLTSFTNNDPLWVVDGVVVDNGGIGYLNQYDIESMEVLKDAASQAIYGARAAAGVILVTTKKGKAGGLTVNYNGYYGLSAPAKKLKLLNASEYAMLRNEQSVNAGKAAPFADPNSFGQGTDWQDQIFNSSAPRQNHEISVSGGTDRSTFYGSIGYLKQDGIVATDISKYERVNIRLNSTHKLSKYVTVGQNLGYAYDKSIGLGNTNNEFGGPLSSAINLDPITPAIVTDPAVAAGAPYNNVGAVKDANGRPYGISGQVGQEITNPLAYIQTRLGNYSWSHNIVGNVYLEIQPVKGLRIRSSVGSKVSFWGGETFTPVSWLNSSTIRSVNSFQRTNNQRFDYNLENTISYNKSFGLHDLTLLVGQGAYLDNHVRGTDVTYSNLPVNNFKDAALTFKVPTDQVKAIGTENWDHKVSSLFARLNYTYDEKYLFTGVIRRDGSSRFGDNNRYGYFPSFSMGWVTSKENFWPQNRVVDFLKIRGGYGVVGNDNIGDGAYLPMIVSGRNYAFGTGGSYKVGYSPSAPANPDLRWEQTSQTNIGFEATLFHDLFVNFDWYRKLTTGILQPLRIPDYIGYSNNPPSNVADMENTGLELELGYRKQIGEVNLGLNGNVSYVKNKVTDLGDGKQYITQDQATFQSTSYPITRTVLGQPYNSFYGFQTAGIFQNQAEIDAYTNKEGKKIQPNAAPGDFRWADINGDGQINENDRTIIGNPIPKWTFGFTVNAAYKGFDLVVFTQGAAGYKIFQGLRRLDITTANWQEKALGRWHGEGTSTDFPRLNIDDPNRNFTNPSDFFLENGSYWRLKTVQLGYTLPLNVTKRVGMQKVRVYVMSENLLTITGYTGYDPEIGNTNATGVFSIDRGIYPQARSYMLGLNVTF